MNGRLRLAPDEHTEDERDLDLIAAELIRLREDQRESRQGADARFGKLERKLDEVLAEQALVRHARTAFAERIDEIARHLNSLANAARKAGL